MSFRGWTWLAITLGLALFWGAVARLVAHSAAVSR